MIPQRWKDDDLSVYNYFVCTYLNGFGLTLLVVAIALAALVAFGGDKFSWWFLLTFPGALMLALSADLYGYRRLISRNRKYYERNPPLHITIRNYDRDMRK